MQYLCSRLGYQIPAERQRFIHQPLVSALGHLCAVFVLTMRPCVLTFSLFVPFSFQHSAENEDMSSGKDNFLVTSLIWIVHVLLRVRFEKSTKNVPNISPTLRNTVPKKLQNFDTTGTRQAHVRHTLGTKQLELKLFLFTI